MAFTSQDTSSPTIVCSSDSFQWLLVIFQHSKEQGGLSFAPHLLRLHCRTPIYHTHSVITHVPTFTSLTMTQQLYPHSPYSLDCCILINYTHSDSTVIPPFTTQPRLDYRTPIHPTYFETTVVPPIHPTHSVPTLVSTLTSWTLTQLSYPHTPCDIPLATDTEPYSSSNLAPSKVI